MATNNATNSSIVGTASQITVSSPTGTSTLSIPSVFVAPGSIAPTTSVLLPPLTGSTDGSIFIDGNHAFWQYPNSGTNYSVFVGGAGNTANVFGTTLNNVFIGRAAVASNSLNGISQSIVIGALSGTSLSTSSTNNIIIGYNIVGASSTSNSITIGNSSATSCIIAGISGVSVSNLNLVTINTSTGQLGSQAITTGIVTSITGTANQITASASTGAVTLSLPSAITTPGSLTATTTLTATAGAITATAGNVVITSGNLTLPTTSSSVGQIVVNGTAWAHSFGTGSTFVGSGSGNFTLSGNNSTAYGAAAAASLTTSNRGTFIGHNSGNAITTANDCTALGKSSLASNISSGNNLACGSLAGTALTTTSPNNTLIGTFSGQALTTGSSDNTILGYNSANGTTSGVLRNVAIGSGVASAWTGSEADNILIGYGIAGTAAQTNTIRIGAQGAGSGQQNSCFIAGITGVTVTGSAVLCSTSGLLGTVVSSERYKENIQDMGETNILGLRPVTFTMKKETFRDDSEPFKQFGLIAEEVAAIMPELVVYDKGFPESVKYHEMPAILLNEIQKLVKRIEVLELALKEKA